MSIYKAISHKRKLVGHWDKQGLTEQQKKVRIHAYLSEAKRKHLKEEES